MMKEKHNIRLYVKMVGILMITALFLTSIKPIKVNAKAYEYKIYRDKTSSYRRGSYKGMYKSFNIKKNLKIGAYPKRAGVILITQSGSLARIVGHAGIVYSKNNVIESLERGVCVGANNWATSKKRVAAATSTYTTCAQDKKVAMWCARQVGKKYNFNYYSMSTRKKFYCSQLVWAGFKDVLGINLNTSAYDIKKLTAIGPFEFVRRDTSKLFLIYMKNWTKKDVTK